MDFDKRSSGEIPVRKTCNTNDLVSSSERELQRVGGGPGNISKKKIKVRNPPILCNVSDDS